MNAIVGNWGNPTTVNYKVYDSWLVEVDQWRELELSYTSKTMARNKDITFDDAMKVVGELAREIQVSDQ